MPDDKSELRPFRAHEYLDSVEAVDGFLRDILDNCHGEPALLISALEDAWEAMNRLYPTGAAHLQRRDNPPGD